MKTIEEFIWDLPKDEREMCIRLRSIILNAVPDITEKFSYGVPYFFRHSRVLCIWPSSVWGGPPKGVFLGICRGNLISNENGVIEMGNRKEFGLIRFFDAKEIKEEVLLEIIHEAIMVDEEVAKRKKERKKTLSAKHR
jgi:uncharacterized protein YdhG (YjbR/CyaY superfamily)